MRGEAWRVELDSWRVERRDRKAKLLSYVAAHEGGEWFVRPMEAVRIESWSGGIA